MVLWTAAGAAAADPVSRLQSARLTIELADEAVRVEASYRLTAAGGPVRFRIRRLAGQQLRWLDDPPGKLHELPGLSYFDVEHGMAVAVRYELRGGLERIPLFVPEAPTDPTAGAIAIRLSGVAADVVLRDGFPRLLPESDGVLVARPANLPSLVRLPPPRGRLTTNRLAETAVAVLLVLATAGWLLGRRRARAVS